MRKREFLALAGALWAGAGAVRASGGAAGAVVHVACAGAHLQGAQVHGYWVGVMQPQWERARMERLAHAEVPSRAHGLAALPDGGFVAVGNRPGWWLGRFDAQAQPVRMLNASEAVRSFEGHVTVSADGQWLYTTETDPRTAQGWVAVRDVRTLQTVAQWRTGGSEPHQLLLDATGALLVANGGVLRTAGDRKIDLHRMDSSLVRLRPETGERLGQWRLGDRRLGLRHMAWGHAPDGQTPLLGIALQNEHDDPAQRRQSPLLALWDGSTLQLPAARGQGDGYAGDIVPTPVGGFVLSSQRGGVVLHWSPQQPDTTRVLAQLKDPGALVALPGAAPGGETLLAAQASAARWSGGAWGGALAWPEGLQVDNHWVALRVPV